VSHRGLYMMSDWSLISTGRRVCNHGNKSVEGSVGNFEKSSWVFDTVNWADEFKLPLEFVVGDNYDELDN